MKAETEHDHHRCPHCAGDLDLNTAPALRAAIRNAEAAIESALDGLSELTGMGVESVEVKLTDWCGDGRTSAAARIRLTIKTLE